MKLPIRKQARPPSLLLDKWLESDGLFRLGKLENVGVTISLSVSPKLLCYDCFMTHEVCIVPYTWWTETKKFRFLLILLMKNVNV